MVEYEVVRGLMKTGDVLLFAGEGLFSRVIRRVTGGTWSHVGLVVVVEPTGVGERMVAVWESTTLSPVADAETGAVHRGVSLVPLSERVATMRGRIAWRRLNRPITGEMERALWGLRRRLSRTPYEREGLELLASAYDGWGGRNAEDLRSVFCSELVAEAYQAMGLLREPEEGGWPSNEYTPRDFSTEAREGLRLREGWALGGEVELLVGRASVSA